MSTHGAAPSSVVLVVEDDPLQLLNATDIVTEAGFEVIEATNADEAIAILESRNDIRIIFTDVDMPGSMDGLKLAAAVRNRWPPIEIIITSGARLPSDWEMPERGVFFPKPYDARILQDRMKEMAG
ncbi:Response regulatory domain-containing protein [Hyphomicrobiales bacterium]|nr:Response regulatory domain-containing protein [Hyphomicrobiales bacterium]CAH1693151.1 Response regulatory domain-containing protein [Hyphomicrobiales bacterium]